MSELKPGSSEVQDVKHTFQLKSGSSSQCGYYDAEHGSCHRLASDEIHSREFPSVQDVDRCVNEKQNSGSGEMQKTAPCYSQTAFPKDIELTLVETRKRRAKLYEQRDGTFPPSIVLNDIDALLSIIDILQVERDVAQASNLATLATWEKALDSFNRVMEKNKDAASRTKAALIERVRAWGDFYKSQAAYFAQAGDDAVERMRLQQADAVNEIIHELEAVELTQDTKSSEASHSPDDTVAGSLPHQSNSESFPFPSVSEATAAGLLAATRQILAEYEDDPILQLQSQAIDRFLNEAHQPPEQNLEDKNSVSPKPKAPSHSSVVIPESVSLDADPQKGMSSYWRNRGKTLAERRPGKTFQRSDGILACDQCCFGDRCDERGHFDRESCPYCLGTGINATTQPENDRQTTTEGSPSPASLPESESPTESESTLVTVDEAARRATEKIVTTTTATEFDWAKLSLTDVPTDDAAVANFDKAHGEEIIKRIAEIIVTELSVHQPDVQAADVQSELLLLLRRMSELTLDEGFSGHHQNGFEMFRTQAEAVIKSRLAASPVQPEVSKEQDNAKS